MDLKQSATSVFANAKRLILADLEALPEDAITKKFGEKTRTVADIVYEINLVNDHIGMCLRGEEPFEWPDGDWITAPAGFETKSQVIDAFKASTDRITKTIEAFTEEDLEATMTTEHGETTRYARVQFMAMHMWYHSGQFNYVQTLLGDDGWHW